jgi:hypothetical protein
VTIEYIGKQVEAYARKLRALIEKDPRPHTQLEVFQAIIEEENVASAKPLRTSAKAAKAKKMRQGFRNAIKKLNRISHD